MSTQVATRGDAGVQAKPFDPPRLSPRLAGALDALLNPHPDIGPRAESLPVHTRTEAAHALKRYADLCRPAGPEIVRRWLLTLNSAVRNPCAPTDFDKRAEVIAHLVGELPVAVFTVRTQRMAMAAFQFWPSAAEVLKLLREEAAPLTSRRDTLKRLVNAPQAQQRQSLTAEERDRIAAKFRADMQAVFAERATGPEPRKAPRASHLTGEALARARQAANAVRS